MSLYLEQIKQLIELQRIDDEIINLKKILDTIPTEIETLEKKISTLKAQEEEVRERVNVLSEKQKKLVKEIEEDEFKIKKSKNKLMMVQTAKEYNAVLKEIDTLEKSNRLREEERIAIEEDLATQTSLLESISSEIKESEEELTRLKKKQETEVENAKKRLKELEIKRKETTKHIPQPILSRYEFIRVRLKNPVIVAVRDGVCTGCYISIPPQTLIELQRAKEILSCPNCQRIIYWEPLFNKKE